MKTLFMLLFCIFRTSQALNLKTKRGECSHEVSETKSGYTVLRYLSRAQEECTWEVAALDDEKALVLHLTQIDMSYRENGVKSCSGELAIPASKVAWGCNYPLQTKAYVSITSMCKLSSVLSKVKPLRSEILVRADRTSSKLVQVKSLSQKSKSFRIEFKIIDCTEIPEPTNSTDDSGVSPNGKDESKMQHCPRTSEDTVFIAIISVLIFVLLVLCLGLFLLYRRRQNTGQPSAKPEEGRRIYKRKDDRQHRKKGDRTGGNRSVNSEDKGVESVGLSPK